MTERDPSELLAGRPLITKEEERERSVPTECHTESRIHRVARQRRTSGWRLRDSVLSNLAASLAATERQPVMRQGLGAREGSREGLFPTRLKRAGRGRLRDRAKMRGEMGAGDSELPALRSTGGRALRQGARGKQVQAERGGHVWG